jgi:large subunit ribosomal protein L3
MSNKMTIQAILGRKLGTTSMVRESGDMDCVTAIVAGPCTITQLKTADNDGYAAIQIGFEEAKTVNKPMTGHLSASGNNFKHLAEVRLPDPESTGAEVDSPLNVGQVISVSSFNTGDRVDVTGYSKGRGFAGTIKRHGFHGGPKTHGQSDRHRAPGSIGAGSTPGKVIKGKKMSGHYGDEKITVQNLEVVQTDSVRNLIFVKGAIPGARNSIMYLRRSIKDLRSQGLIVELQEPEIEDPIVDEEPTTEVVEKELKE